MANGSLDGRTDSCDMGETASNCFASSYITNQEVLAIMCQEETADKSRLKPKEITLVCWTCGEKTTSGKYICVL